MMIISTANRLPRSLDTHNYFLIFLHSFPFLFINHLTGTSMHRWYFSETHKNRLKTYQIALNKIIFELMSLNDQNILFLPIKIPHKKDFPSWFIIKVSNFQYELDIDWFIHVKWLRKSEIQFFEINTLEHF